jgi:excisionase family DNA binding protein
VSAAHQLLTAHELAERWQVPKGQVYRLTREGLIPAVRLGRYYRYRLEAIEQWESHSEQLSRSPAQVA